MNKWIALTLASLMAMPVAFATETSTSAPEEILIDATAGDDLSSEMSTEANEYDRYRPGPQPGPRPPGHRPPPRPPRPNPPRPNPPRPNPPRPNPPRQAWVCLARDLVRNGYRYVDYDLAWARHGALRECNYRSPVGRCYLVTCDRY
ncbi:MAG: hypothetical protein V4760_18685 [Bdellovibrionota bacterium]